VQQPSEYITADDRPAPGFGREHDRALLAETLVWPTFVV
jgi:hypothetical protein